MAAASSSTPFFGIRDEDQQQQIKQQQQQQQQQQTQQQQSSASTPTSSATPATAPPQKKKRNLPGTPNPDAEVIALSPKTLMATNRFICEVCNKGFQREQNLQLHRRGHNLPWKLRQKTTKEVRRRVYLCPEPTCVHHDPSRALGDLTGIKKHFCRKHGEKKWKCDKCSKRYAVQSDWKAHSKTCGTREYRCDCGTLFSRRDSFITHRAFCDALAQESARLPTGLSTMGSHLYGGSSNNNNMGLGLSQLGSHSQLSSLQDHHHHHHHQSTPHPSTDILRLGAGAGASQLDHLIPGAAASNPSTFRPPPSPNPSSAFFLPSSSHDLIHHEDQTHHGLIQSKPFHGLMQLPDLQNNAGSSSLFNLGFFSNGSGASSMNSAAAAAASAGLLIPEGFGGASNGGEGSSLFAGNIMGDHHHHMGPGPGPVSSLYSAGSESVLPQMSATALLQKAAQMGATTSSLRGFGGGGSSSGGAKPDRGPHLSSSGFRGGFGGGAASSQMENESHLQDLMNSLANGGSSIYGAMAASSGAGGGAHEQEGAFGAYGSGQHHGAGGMCNVDEAKLHQNLSVSMGGSDRLTRDFLGVGGMVRSMGGAGGISQREQQQQQQQQHSHGLDIGSLDSDMKSASGGSRSFGGSLQ
ncbi:hypothetical protein H6P81_018296 [Aristolochia fimbriata]|uniref:C2H2-type domain-containing protein n=1 Tax=Aristolochia fimbriata TaxID=158543 RepID=A0AAV7E3Q2_ARIFI|nr:hypothetical protein H6P81_018296 [Aristolochia fimbriata]